MALTYYCRLSRLFTRNVKPFSLTSIITLHSHENRNLFDEDIVDKFVTQLMDKKSNSWERQRQSYSLKKCRNESVSFKYKNDLMDLEINNLFKNAIDEHREVFVIKFIQHCIEIKKCPDSVILLNVLDICSQSGETKLIEDISELCRELNPDLLIQNAYFQHYLAKSIWIKGHITKALDLLEEVYDENPYLRRSIRLIVKTLMTNIENNKSEAVLIKIIKFSERLVEKHKDYFFLSCVWQICFLSEWFSDQKIALELLHTNKELCTKIVNRIPFVISVSLRNNKIDVVYRLLEILIKYHMQTHISFVLLALFDYQIMKGDLRCCSEIIKWSLKNNIVLPAVYQQKYLQLLVGYNTLVTKPENRKLKYNFKF